MNISEQQQAWNQHYRRERARLIYPDENLVRMLGGVKPGSALDFGCGSGRHIKLLLESGFSPVSGIDLSSESLELCRRHYPEANFHPLTTTELESSDFRLPFKDASFALIISWGVLHYNPADIQKRILAELRRLLKEDGVFCGTVRAEDDTHFRTTPDLAGIEIQYFSESDLQELLRPFFSQIEIGFMQRTPLGEPDKFVSHWFFKAAP